MGNIYWIKFTLITSPTEKQILDEKKSETAKRLVWQSVFWLLATLESFCDVAEVLRDHASHNSNNEACCD